MSFIPIDDDTLLRQIKHDMSYYHAGRKAEREWIITYLRNNQHGDVADDLANLKDLEDDGFESYPYVDRQLRPETGP